MNLSPLSSLFVLLWVSSLSLSRFLSPSVGVSFLLSLSLSLRFSHFFLLFLSPPCHVIREESVAISMKCNDSSFASQMPRMFRWLPEKNTFHLKKSLCVQVQFTSCDNNCLIVRDASPVCSRERGKEKGKCVSKGSKFPPVILPFFSLPLPLSLGSLQSPAVESTCTS